MPPSSPSWLDVVRHRIRGFRAPFLLVVQHHDIRVGSRLVAPVTRPVPSDVDILSPSVVIGDASYRVRLLDITPVPVSLLGETVATLEADRDPVLNALDVILHGYPVGRPI